MSFLCPLHGQETCEDPKTSHCHRTMDHTHIQLLHGAEVNMELRAGIH